MKTQRRNQGSVLVPVVAAMLILALCGIALSEVFSSQRMQTVISVESAQASWIAEAGIWHAASTGKGISKPVGFAGGTYTVSKDGDQYVSKSNRGNANRTVSLSISSADDDDELSSPLYEKKSADTAEKKGSSRIDLELYSKSSKDVYLSSFELKVSPSSASVKSFRLEHRNLWSDSHGKKTPTGKLEFSSSSSNREIESKESVEMSLQFKSKVESGASYTLILYFEDGSQSTLKFSLDDDDDDDHDD